MQYSLTQRNFDSLKNIWKSFMKSVMSHFKFCYPMLQFSRNKQCIQQKISCGELEREGPVIQNKK